MYKVLVVNPDNIAYGIPSDYEPHGSDYFIGELVLRGWESASVGDRFTLYAVEDDLAPVEVEILSLGDDNVAQVKYLGIKIILNKGIERWQSGHYTLPLADYLALEVDRRHKVKY